MALYFFFQKYIQAFLYMLNVIKCLKYSQIFIIPLVLKEVYFGARGAYWGTFTHVPDGFDQDFWTDKIAQLHLFHDWTIENLFADRQLLLLLTQTF